MQLDASSTNSGWYKSCLGYLPILLTVLIRQLGKCIFIHPFKHTHSHTNRTAMGAVRASVLSWGHLSCRLQWSKMEPPTSVLQWTSHVWLATVCLMLVCNHRKPDVHKLLNCILVSLPFFSLTGPNEWGAGMRTDMQTDASKLASIVVNRATMLCGLCAIEWMYCSIWPMPFMCVCVIRRVVWGAVRDIVQN